jgi:disulfide oxidoreductase YuzD
MERRYGDSAVITYYDISVESVKKEHTKLVDEIETRGLLYPVTVIDGTPIYDGAVSYPAILRAVQQKLERAAERA